MSIAKPAAKKSSLPILQGILPIVSARVPIDIIAGIIAVLIGAALVFFIFPKRDEERQMLVAYHQQDMAEIAAEMTGKSIPSQEAEEAH